MDRFIGWPPIFWTLRIRIPIVLVGGLHVFLLLISRFFRLKTVRAMLLADPPRVDPVGGEFAGAKAELTLHRGASEAEMEAFRVRLEELRTIVNQAAIQRSREERTDEQPPQLSLGPGALHGGVQRALGLLHVPFRARRASEER